MAEPIRVSKRGVYTPEWGNENRKKDDKIVVHYRFLPFSEQQELLYYEDVGKTFAYESRVLSRMVEMIENLSIEDDKGTREIVDGESLVAEPGLDKLAMELWLHLRNKSAIDEEGKKK